MRSRVVSVAKERVSLTLVVSLPERVTIIRASNRMLEHSVTNVTYNYAKNVFFILFLLNKKIYSSGVVKGVFVQLGA